MNDSGHSLQKSLPGLPRRLYIKCYFSFICVGCIELLGLTMTKSRVRHQNGSWNKEELILRNERDHKEAANIIRLFGSKQWSWRTEACILVTTSIIDTWQWGIVFKKLISIHVKHICILRRNTWRHIVKPGEIAMGSQPSWALRLRELLDVCFKVDSFYL